MNESVSQTQLQLATRTVLIIISDEESKQLIVTTTLTLSLIIIIKSLIAINADDEWRLGCYDHTCSNIHFI